MMVKDTFAKKKKKSLAGRFEDGSRERLEVSVMFHVIHN